MFEFKKAFTLMEILVVLIIIAITAAFTLPDFIKESKIEMYESKFKIAINDLNSAVALATAKRKVVNGKDGDNQAKFFGNYIDYKDKFASGIRTKNGMDYFFYGLKSNADSSCGEMPESPTKMTENNFSNAVNNNACAVVIVDVNGDDGPNKLTTSNVRKKMQDMFLLYLFTDGVTPGPYPAGKILDQNYAKDLSSSNAVVKDKGFAGGGNGGSKDATALAGDMVKFRTKGSNVSSSFGGEEKKTDGKTE